GYYSLGVNALSAVGNRKGYAGYELNWTLLGAKWDVRHRVLDSDLGRWTRRDPLGYVDGMGLYGYVGGRLNFVDPYGLARRREAAQSESGSQPPCGGLPMMLAGVGVSCPGSDPTNPPPLGCPSIYDDARRLPRAILAMARSNDALVPPASLWGNHCGPGYGDSYETCGDDPNRPFVIALQLCGPHDMGRL